MFGLTDPLARWRAFHLAFGVIVGLVTFWATGLLALGGASRQALWAIAVGIIYGLAVFWVQRRLSFWIADRVGDPRRAARWLNLIPWALTAILGSYYVAVIIYESQQVSGG